MNKLVLIVGTAMLLAACGGGNPCKPGFVFQGSTGSCIKSTAPPTPDLFVKTCELNWEKMEVEPGDESMMASLIINREQLPNTVGSVLKECLLDGWRPPGL